MSQIFNIQDDKVIINKLALRYLEGSIIHAGNLDIAGSASVQSNLVVNGTISADTINVKNLVTDSGSLANVGNWTVSTEEELAGKGFSWAHGNAGYNLIYRDGGRIWTNADLDLEVANSYKIDNVSVLSAGVLGASITKSNLKQVGTLNQLNVTGDTNLSEFAFFNSGLGRLGINTDQPNAALSIAENDVELVFGSPEYGQAEFGTYTNHDLSIITDNTARVVIKNNGDITFKGDVTINGTLKVDTIVTDTRIDRYSPLEFKSTRDTAIYGKGLLWSGTGNTRQLIMLANPDRLWTSESFDIGIEQSYYVNGVATLSATTLGEHVTNSSLTKVGILQSLTVNGPVSLVGNIDAVHSTAQLKSAVFNSNLNELNIISTGLSTTNNISITTAQDEVFYADVNEINVGNKSNVRRPVKIYGPVSVGVSNPDPEVDLTVKGNVSFANKKFITGLAAPKEGTFNQGDICWNEDPQSDNYIGWVCVAEGAPGTWMPFGAIARQ
jgi:hypothetical protein